MYKGDKIDWSKLETEHTVYIQVPQVKKLSEGIFVCPECNGEGHIVTVHHTFPQHKYGKCYMCDGTGEIIKCIHHGCNESVANNQHTNPTKLCCMHEEERIDEIYKKASEQLEKNKR